LATSRQSSLKRLLALPAGVPQAQGPATLSDVEKHLAVADLSSAEGQEAAWRKLLAGPLSARRAAFAAYEEAFKRTYARRNVERDGPPLAWFPRSHEAAGSHAGRWMIRHNAKTFADFHAWTAGDREAFWSEFLQEIRFPSDKKISPIRAPGSSVTRPDWLPGTPFNIAEICLRAAPSQRAIVYGREGTDDLTVWTYARLRETVDAVANGLDRLGLGENDRIALYLPMTPESVAIYLGILKSGRVAVGIADASAAPDVEKRCRLSGAKLVFTMDAYLRDGKELKVYEKAKAANAPRAVVLPAEHGGQATSLRAEDLPWNRFLAPGTKAVARARSAKHEANILFSSGTTKDPKAIVWTHATPIKCLVDSYFHQDVHTDDVLAWPTSFGWMMGPWLTFASLGHGATMALFNGSPLGAAFGRFIEATKATMLGVVPKIVKAWRVAGTMEPFDWSSIRRFSSTGETSDPDDMLYLMWLAGTKPVIEYCGGTEIGGGYVTGTMVQPASPATFTTASVGLDFLVVDEGGAATSRGEVAIVPPSFGLSNDILNYDHEKEYFAGFHRTADGTPLRRHGDQLERLGRGYIRHHGRMDDMINLNGVKTSVEELRAVINHHPAIYDSKPIAVDVEGKGQLVVYAVPKDKARIETDELQSELRLGFSKLIKERLNPLLSQIHDVVLVAELPQAGPGKTRTQKEFLKDYASRRDRRS
jgi:acetyl-CoA synthetase